MRIVVAAHGRFHAFRLAHELHNQRHLAALFTNYPAFFARRHVGRGSRIVAAPLLEIRRRYLHRWALTRLSDLELAHRFATFTATRLPEATDILVGWSGATLEAIAPARRLGAKVVIERGSTHIAHQAEVLTREYAEFGVTVKPVDPEMIAREIAEYEAADAIAVPSQAAAETFLARGIGPERLIVNPYGADIHLRPVSQRHPTSRPIRILFVGSVSLRKGVPWLLRAFAKVRAPAELHVVGPIEPAAAAVLRGETLHRVTFHGPLRGPRLERAYAEADIFCLPSLEEGFSLAVLEAMAAALPVVITRETGAADRVESGREGLIVPARDAVSLASALEALVIDPDKRLEMGSAARAKIGSDTTWGHYGERAIAAYQRLLLQRRPVAR